MGKFILSPTEVNVLTVYWEDASVPLSMMWPHFLPRERGNSKAKSENQGYILDQGSALNYLYSARQ